MLNSACCRDPQRLRPSSRAPRPQAPKLLKGASRERRYGVYPEKAATRENQHDPRPSPRKRSELRTAMSLQLLNLRALYIPGTSFPFSKIAVKSILFTRLLSFRELIRSPRGLRTTTSFAARAASKTSLARLLALGHLSSISEIGTKESGAKRPSTSYAPAATEQGPSHEPLNL